jgi:hypothetical protein
MLRDTAPADIELPAYEDHEDFVSGTLRFGDEVLRIYYEHALGYLALTSDKPDSLHDLIARLRSQVIVPSLQAVEDMPLSARM